MHRPTFRSYTLPPDDAYPFYVVANRYPHPNFRPDANETAHTFVMLHSTSFHKEVLEPTLSDVFALTLGQSNIREAWIIECPNHGESAVMNNATLVQPRYQGFFSCERYAEAAYRFLHARSVDSLRTTLDTDKIIGVGHSLGGCGIVFLANMMQTFYSLVLLDPFLFPGRQEDISRLRSILVSAARKRKNTWPTKEDAYNAFKERRWEERVARLYADYGVYKTTSKIGSSDHRYTLACSREQEITMYQDPEGATKPIPYLNSICDRIPVHIAFGQKANVIPRDVQEELVNPLLRRFATVERIERAGHLLPQENPRGAAHFIVRALLCDVERSRL